MLILALSGNLETEVEYNVLHRDEGQPEDLENRASSTAGQKVKVPIVEIFSMITRLEFRTERIMVSGTE